MFESLLKLFGCSPKNNQDKYQAQTDSLKQQIAQSIETFKNKPAITVLTVEIIDTTSDEDLLYMVFDNLCSKLPTDYTKEYEAVLTWNKSRQTIFVTFGLEAEVNNGGYNQYYYNSTGQYYKLAPDALELIGATKYAELTRKADETYEKDNKKITKELDGTLEGFSKSYKDNPLNKFDDEFYALAKIENIEKLQIQYIREHKKDFIDK